MCWIVVDVGHIWLHSISFVQIRGWNEWRSVKRNVLMRKRLQRTKTGLQNDRRRREVMTMTMMSLIKNVTERWTRQEGRLQLLHCVSFCLSCSFSVSTVSQYLWHCPTRFQERGMSHVISTIKIRPWALFWKHQCQWQLVNLVEDCLSRRTGAEGATFSKCSSCSWQQSAESVDLSQLPVEETVDAQSARYCEVWYEHRRAGLTPFYTLTCIWSQASQKQAYLIGVSRCPTSIIKALSF